MLRLKATHVCSCHFHSLVNSIYCSSSKFYCSQVLPTCLSLIGQFRQKLYGFYLMSTIFLFLCYASRSVNDNFADSMLEVRHFYLMDCHVPDGKVTVTCMFSFLSMLNHISKSHCLSSKYSSCYCICLSLF